MAVHELGLEDRIALERVVVSARSTNAAVMAANPLNKIPTLILPDGSSLFDSRVIVAFLDEQAVLVPAQRDRRLGVLRLQALGIGLMELNVARMSEANRGEAASAPHADAARAKTAAALDHLERDPPTELCAGSIAVAVALSHLDFRFAGDRWRDGRPRLARWFDAFDQRPSMRATRPEDIY